MNIAEIYKKMSYGPAPEANDKVLNWLADHKDGFNLFIDGEWYQQPDADYFDSQNPATGEVIGKLTQANQASIDKAVAAARAAQPGWEAIGGHGRARYLYAIARLIQQKARSLAVLETMDNGKPIRESKKADIPLVIRHFYHHAGWAQLSDTENKDYKALGVVGQVIPWNFPLLMMAWKIAPAIAAGNCVVLKPAEYTSLSALMLCELFAEAGLPKGVVNIVTGDGAVGEMIVKHPDIDKIAFTGSTAVGRKIREQTAGSGKKLTLELGGKSPYIVFDDADIDSAVEGLVDSIWFNQGQVCCAGSRLLIQESIEEVFLDKVKARMAKLIVGSPLDKNTDVGAIVDEIQKQRIDSIVQQSIAEGGQCWQPECELPDSGCYYPPTLLTGLNPTNIGVREEIFGPVLSVLTFREQKEAVALANNTVYGLASTIWSDNINRALDVAPQIKAGVVWVNTSNRFDAACGFGGYKESGMGREGGAEGMLDYMQPKQSLATKHKPAKSTTATAPAMPGLGTINRTAKLYIGRKQCRPDNENTLEVLGSDGSVIGRVPDGSRKDIRNAVEAAAKAQSWASNSQHGKAQILYYIAENLACREAEFCQRLMQSTGADADTAKAEFEASLDVIFTYAAWCDKYDGAVHSPPMRGVTLAMHEAVGVIGICCPDESPLLAFISLLMPAIAMGNTTVVVPSTTAPLVVTDFYQVLETSDVPAGVVNIVTGPRDPLAEVLADHLQVDSIWYQGSAEGSKVIEARSISNLKRTWVNNGDSWDWHLKGEARQFLRQATEVKNIWIPYGD
jgi:aldehyde dehydrogenase (NAD+)